MEDIRSVNIHILCDIYSPREEGPEHFHDKQYPQISQVFLIFHRHRVGEACCPSHQLRLFAAEKHCKQETFMKNVANNL